MKQNKQSVEKQKRREKKRKKKKKKKKESLMTITQDFESCVFKKVDWNFLQGPLHLWSVYSGRVWEWEKCCTVQGKKPIKDTVLTSAVPSKRCLGKKHSIWNLSEVIMVLVCIFRLKQPTLFLIISLPIILSTFFFFFLFNVF